MCAKAMTAGPDNNYLTWASIAAIGICLRDEAQKCVNSEQRKRLHNYASRLVEIARELQGPDDE